MRVEYEGKKLEKLCTDEREMRKKRGDIADRLRLRINALKTAESVGELPSHDQRGGWHRLSGDLDGLWAGRLSKNHRLLIRPEDSSDPLEAETVTVVGIIDYH